MYMHAYPPVPAPAWAKWVGDTSPARGRRPQAPAFRYPQLRMSRAEFLLHLTPSPCWFAAALNQLAFSFFTPQPSYHQVLSVLPQNIGHNRSNRSASLHFTSFYQEATCHTGLGSKPPNWASCSHLSPSPRGNQSTGLPCRCPAETHSGEPSVIPGLRPT